MIFTWIIQQEIYMDLIMKIVNGFLKEIVGYIIEDQPKNTNL